MMSRMHPRDETQADKDETDPFAGSEDEAGSEEYSDNPGKAMAKHIISEGEEEASDTSEERSSEMIIDGEEASEPAAASTPTRKAKETFRIVTIEPPVALTSGSKQNFVPISNSADGHSGEANTAATTAAESSQVDKDHESDGNSAEKEKGEDNSASTTQQKGSVKNKSDAGTAKKNIPLGKAMETEDSKYRAFARRRPNRLKSKPPKLMPFPAPATKPFSMQRSTS